MYSSPHPQALLSTAPHRAWPLTSLKSSAPGQIWKIYIRRMAVCWTQIFPSHWMQYWITYVFIGKFIYFKIEYKYCICCFTFSLNLRILLLKYNIQIMYFTIVLLTFNISVLLYNGQVVKLRLWEEEFLLVSKKLICNVA